MHITDFYSCHDNYEIVSATTKRFFLETVFKILSEKEKFYS